MLRYIDHEKMGRSNSGWLDSYFHFSFADYYNANNINFGILRVLNDDKIQIDTGFDTHPHRDMEIITYVIDGQLTHADSMDNRQTLKRGQVQYMSAGTGVFHSEHNLGTEILRLFQIWILPDKQNYEPNYGDYRFEIAERQDKWLPIASGVDNDNSKAPIRIHADINMYATMISKDNEMVFQTGKGRQTYFALIEGQASVNGILLHARDALEIIEEDVTIQAMSDVHVLVIEMKKE